MFGLVMLLRQIRPDIILTYTIKPVVYGSIAAWIAEVPSRNAMITGLGYTFMSESFKQKLLNVFAKGLYRVALRHARIVFFQNLDDLRLFKKLSLIGDFSKPILINGSGVDLSHFQAAPHPARPAFLLIARLIKEKGIHEYVQAARIVKKQYPDTLFYLAGWIDVVPGAISNCELDTWRNEGVIEYLGKLDDVRPAIKACSVYALPSYREGTPRTVLEAMAMGRAIITTDTPGCRQTVTHGRNGLLVPLKNVNALAEAMQYLITHPQMVMAMGQESRLMAQELFDVNTINDIMLRELGLSQNN